ncbi:hypothetical protein ACRAQ7_09760 [Erythrobacter sp. W53]|uniref:hypothetical protein n=1 Tax=Erythrobacter sp. W53 TaxID=3425947 RepID=UPI003D769873
MSVHSEIKSAKAAVAHKQKPLKGRLEAGFAPLMIPVFADLCDEVLELAGKQKTAAPARAHAEVLVRYCTDQAAVIAEFGKSEQTFQMRLSNAVDEAEQRAAILDFARDLGASRKQLNRDGKAFDAFLDADAILERLQKRIGEKERALAFGIERLGYVAGDALVEDPSILESAFLVDLLEGLLADMRGWRGDARVRRAAHTCLAEMARHVERWPHGIWFDSILSATRRVCFDMKEDVWVQCAALDALLALSPNSVPTVIERRFDAGLVHEAPAVRDNELFVRRHMVRIVCANYVRVKPLRPLLHTLANDLSGAVRQVFADSLHLLPADQALGILKRLRTDRDPQVRAAIFADVPRMLLRIEPYMYGIYVARILKQDEDEFVLRMALDAAADLAACCVRDDDRDTVEVIAGLRQALTVFCSREVSPKLLRWADEAAERIWLAADSDAREIASILHKLTQGQFEADIRKAKPLKPWLESEREKVGRVMAVLAQNKFGLSLKSRGTPKIQRGEWLKRRGWRILFEGRNSATDKRQAFLHTTGRHYFGDMIAPSARMAELAPTKVPGEPLMESSEGGWRNYLPLVDQILSAVDKGGTTEVFTSAGITQIDAPDGIWARTRAFWYVSRNFADLAGLRNREPAEYLAKLRELGVEVSLRQYDEAREPNPEIVKFFSAGGAAAALPFVWDKALAYASTVYENNLVELAIFLAIASVWFFGRHIFMGWKARRLRNAISLSLGGWGTRGKSGTERLKAGLINAVGPSIVSKTTGCEAMFLIGTPFGGLTEMFLFRPYDKATIWEQFNLLKTSVGLKTRVFLWECMGLNPAYVRVLQQDWMRDDIGTITNTYPDHEDIQGPAGRNIPEVMCEFIPHNRRLLTTEEEMLPILEEGAAKGATGMRSIGWKEAGLIHQELLERFPYEEHPYNIALVTAMGDELGLEPDYCVREMADRVVADLGVLKTYPRSQVNDRTLEFVMGMSANERFGAMGNWTRMGFDKHDNAKDPDVFVSTVVNNRADRVPRSRVFARMLVHDVAADRHFLIGSNIDGLLGFIDEEWSAYAAALTLFDDEETAEARLERLARHQRIPLNQESLDGLLAAMLKPQADKLAAKDAITAAQSGRLSEALESASIEGATAIAAHYEHLAGLAREYSDLQQAIKAGGDNVSLDTRMRALMERAFKAKLAPVHDFYIKGEMIVRLVADQTPPGLINRIMGMQNIKGTGLDWVYRWQAWETVHKACQQLRADDPAEIERGFRMLASFQEFGILADEEVRAAVAELRPRLDRLEGISDAQLDAIETRLGQQLSKFESAEGEGVSSSGEGADRAGAMLDRVLTMTEGFIDASDAVRRRRASDRIYKALIAEQISLQRAATELKAITARQKGGWLAKSVKERSGKLRSLRKAA